MPVQSPELPDMLLAMVEERLASVFTAAPGIVQSYDQSTQTATVQRAVKLAHRDEQDDRVAETPPPLQGVPVAFPGSGAWSLTWPLSNGDEVLIVHCDCSIDAWLATGGVVDPGDDRRQDFSDVVAIPGLRSYRRALSSGAVSSGAMVLAAAKILLGGTAADSSANQVVVQSALTTFVHALATAIAAAVPGDGGAAALTSLQSSLGSWGAGTTVTRAT